MMNNSSCILAQTQFFECQMYWPVRVDESIVTAAAALV